MINVVLFITLTLIFIKSDDRSYLQSKIKHLTFHREKKYYIEVLQM